jgi:quercetin dioxygenase-like cupin family protein
MTDVAAAVLLPGAGRRITGGSLDATVKITTDHPALTSAFEVVIGPGFDVGAHVHAHGEELFYVVEGELDVLGWRR